MLAYQSNTSQALNQQTLTLLKDQMTKLKLLSNDLELKTQQYEMLKQTVQYLDEQKMSILEQNQKLKTDIIAIIHHNQQQEKIINEKAATINKIENQNQQLLSKVNELRQQLAREEKFNKEITERYQKEILAKQISDTKVNELLSKQNLSKQKDILVAQENEELKRLNETLSTQLASAKSDLKSVTKSFEKYKQENRIKKSQIEQYKKQLLFSKQTIKHLSEKQQELLGIEQQYRQTQKHMEAIQKELRRIEKEHLMIQEENMKYRFKNEEEKNVEYDIKVLSNVSGTETMGRFIGKYKEEMEKIGLEMLKMIKNKSNLQHQISKLEQSFEESQIRNMQLVARVQELERQCKTEQQQYKIQAQNIVNKYESMLVTGSLRIKASERQIQQLQFKSKELSNVQARLLTQTFEVKEKQTNIQELKQSNLHLKSVVQDLIGQCKEGIESKRKLNLLKYAIGNLIRHLFFAVREIKNSMVFKNYLRYEYSKQKPVLDSKSTTKNKKLKKAVYSVIFSIRLKNKTKQWRDTELVNLKDQVLNRVINQSLRFDENHITTSFINEVSSLLTFASLNDNVLVEKLLMTFQKMYTFEGIQFLSPPKLLSSSRQKWNEY